MSALDDLWRVCYVANTEEEALDQRRRQIGPFLGHVLAIDRAMGFGEALDEPDVDFAELIPFRVVSLDDGGEWNDGELIPQWEVTPVDPDQVVTIRGEPLRLGDVRDWIYFAPAVGTRAGFTPRDGREYVEPVPS